MTTLRQMIANRQNASKSTGPKTEEGKAISRRNALTHGLAGAGVVLPDEEEQAATDRAAEWNSSLKPMDPYEVWLVDLIARESVRVDRCHHHEDALRTIEARRAVDLWE